MAGVLRRQLLDVAEGRHVDGIKQLEVVDTPTRHR
jgi:hypothetical protein